jgi:glycosyltransferase involved in cell wall biosynthesis
MKKRVLVFNHFAVQRGAAGGTRHVELFGRLENWDACIIAADRNLQTGRREPSHSPGFRTVPTTPTSGSYMTRVINWISYAFGALIAGVFDTRRPTIVYGSSPHLLAPLAALAVARLRRARFVLEIRDIWPLILAEMGLLDADSGVYRALEWIERFLYRKADAIVVLAEGSAARLGKCGVKPSKICVIPNGAEPSDFIPKTPRDEMRTRLSLTGFVFVYAGAHGEANGLDLVLDAAREIRGDLDDVSFLLVGDGTAKTKLMRRAVDEQLTNVLFLDPIPKVDIPDVLGAADAGLHVLTDVALFRYGVSPNKVYDYMAAGLPVLTNTPGEVTSLVDLAGSGIGVEPDQLAEGVGRMRGAGSDSWVRWGASGKAFMDGHRSRTGLARSLETLLDDVARTAAQ